MVELRAITEDNFLDAFHLRLAPGQENFVSHPIRSLAQAYVYRDQCQPFGIYAAGKMVGYVMVIYKALGCVHVQEIIQYIADKEPCDVQLEYVL